MSIQFLSFLSELEELEELFILERDPKYKPESFAPKTNVSISQIRHLVSQEAHANTKALDD